MSAAARKYPCKHAGCSAVFTKGEHLVRHERGHLGLKPYICQICSRRFGRQDSLLRHCRTHLAHSSENNGTSHQNPSPQRCLVADSTVPSTNDRSIDTCDDTGGPESSISLQSASATHVSSGFDIAQGSCLLPRNLPNPSSVRLDDPTMSVADLAVPKDVLAYGNDFDWNFHDDEIFSLLLTAPTNTGSDGFSRSQFLPDSAQDSSERLADSDWLRGSADAGRKALLAMNRAIQSLPESLVVTTETDDTTSTFFEDCLDLFFRHYLTVVPIIHKPTFNPRECGATVLLHILSLGSCFLPYAAYKVSRSGIKPRDTDITHF